MDMPVLAIQQELTHDSCVKTQNVIRKTCQKRWKKGTDGDWESRKSVLVARLNDDDDDDDDDDDVYCIDICLLVSVNR